MEKWRCEKVSEFEITDLDLELLECVLEDIYEHYNYDMPNELWHDVLYALRVIRRYRTKIAAEACNS